MDFKYMINSGKVEKCNNGEFRFKGAKIDFPDPFTKEIKPFPLISSILFPFELKGGSISFDVEFDDVCDLTNCGFVFNYSLVDGVAKYHQAGIRNDGAFCSLEYFNGKGWDFLTTNGAAKVLEKHKKYALTLKRNGNDLSFFVDNVPVFAYSKLINSTGICGIFILNEHDSIVSNIQIKTEKPTAFSIMKFEKDFDDLYDNVIVHVCEGFGYKSIRADKCYASSPIIQDIVREIAKASLVIADITMDNPNVFYELGYAHALSKPTILLADANKRDKLPFDVSGYRTIFYENTIGGKKEIENLLRKYVENVQG